MRVVRANCEENVLQATTAARMLSREASATTLADLIVTIRYENGERQDTLQNVAVDSPQYPGSRGNRMPWVVMVLTNCSIAPPVQVLLMEDNQLPPLWYT